MRYVRPAHGVLGEHYGVPGSSPRLIAPVLGEGCGAVPHFGGFALGDTAKKDALKAAKYKAQVGADVTLARQVANSVTFSKPARVTVSGGKINVPVPSFWTTWNASAAQITAPFAGAINALPIPSLLRSKLRSRPLDAMLDIFDPIENAVGRAVDKVLAQKGSTQNFFGKNMNLRRVQAVDAKADASTRGLMKTLRTIEAFYVLLFTQPVEFAAALLSEGVNVVGDLAQAAGDLAAQAAKAAGDAAADVIEAAGDAVDAVASFFGLGSVQGLGDGGAVSGPAAAAGASAAAAPAEVAILDAVLATLAGILAGALDTAIAAGAKLVGDTLLGQNTSKPAESSTQGVPISSKLITQTALTQGRASGAFQSTGAGAGAGITDERDNTSSSFGVSPLVVVGGFAAVIALALALKGRK